MSVLFTRFPALGGRIPWRSLGVVPTPVSRATALGADIWIKHDDQSAGVGRYGGNKVRKLEFLLGDALARGRRAVLTIGGTASNHVIATGLYARELGIPHAHAVLFPQPPSPEAARKTEAIRALDVRAARVPRALVPFAAAARWVAALAAGDGVPYAIGPGGSSPLGTLGYVAAGLELAAQIAAGELPAPDAIYVALGSGGTAAGLLLGLRLGGLASTRIVAVQVVPWPWITGGGARRLAARSARLLAAAGADLPAAATAPFGAATLDVVHDQLGPGYGATTAAATAAVARAADAGLTLETTYTGKALAALLAMAAAHRGQRLLFWNTYSAAPPPAALPPPPATMASSSAKPSTR